MTSFFVPGKPLSKGSVVAWKHPKTGAIIKRDEKANELAAWGGRVAAVALAAGVLLDAGPVLLRMTFALERPKGHSGKRGLRSSAPRWPTTKPDTDKLCRAALDALTGIAYGDDAQVIRIEAEKVYADCGPPGVAFTLEPLTAEVAPLSVAFGGDVSCRS